MTTDALRYWELRRVAYNLLLAAVTAGHFIAAWPASRSILTVDGLLHVFGLAVVANVAYCAVYAADLFIQLSGFRDSRRSWRRVLLVVGFAFAAVVTHFVSGELGQAPHQLLGAHSCGVGAAKPRRLPDGRTEPRGSVDGSREVPSEEVESMNRITSRIVSALVLVTGLVVAGAAHAQEHPQGDSKEEHPKGTSQQASRATVTMDDLAAAVQSYVERDARLKGGFFLVYDDLAKKPLALQLVKVHRDRLSKVADQTYFACADFNSIDGAKPYDADIFIKGADKDHLLATQVLIHKEAGKERYTWHEESGVWKRTEVAKR